MAGVMVVVVGVEEEEGGGDRQWRPYLCMPDIDNNLSEGLWL